MDFVIWSIVVFSLLWTFGSGAIAQSNGSDTEKDGIAFFENRIRPILSEHCFECHSARSPSLKGGLMLDSRARMMRGGESGAAIVPENSNDSLLMSAIQYESLEMPPKVKLSKNIVDDFRTWVNMGAPWPKEPEPTKTKSESAFDLEDRKKSHWIWKGPTDPPLPMVRNQTWPKQELDRFILSKLEQQGIEPALSADRRTLIRRLYFDLLGLPPSVEAVERFMADKRNDAIEILVDSLLQSPRFGEHWGRHWLDLVRFAESRGHEFDADIPNAFQYRDYVIRAFNEDVPYDQFVTEHIAGDLLEKPRTNPARGFNESILGTGFWFLGEWVHSPVDIRKDETDRFDNMIDVFSKTFLGLTVGCARCHDHKFDAISSRDYYALSGFLQGSHYRQARFETMEIERAVAKELSRIDAVYSRNLIDSLRALGHDNNKRGLSVLNDLSADISTEVTNWKPTQIPDIADRDNEQIVLFDPINVDDGSLKQDGFSFRRSLDIGGMLRMATDDANHSIPEFAILPSIQNDPFWNGLTAKRGRPTNLRSRIESMPRPGRTLLTKSFEVKLGKIACLIRGAGFVVACVDSHRLVEGPLHGETIHEIKQSKQGFEWVNLNMERYMGHTIHLEFTPAENETFEIFSVVNCNQNKVLAYHADKNAPLTECLHQAIEQISKMPDSKIQLEPRHLDALNWLIRNRRTVSRESLSGLDQVIDRWLEKRNQLRQQVPNESQIAISMIDGTGENDRLLIRGNSSTPGELVARRFLEAIDGRDSEIRTETSGRLELARRITAADNPLTSRVLVNRIWHHMMGRGIVPTVDDFGALGQRPSHPELLDHLAVRFDRNGKSVKKLIRWIALSQSYQMSSLGSMDATEKDPKNELWHQAILKRLSAESIRDSLLAVSEEIDASMYGDSVPVYLTSFMDGRGKPNSSGPLDGEKRRSIYLQVRRNFLSPFLLTFDMPNPFSSMGRRNVSNVPAQALIMMNDPLVYQCAEAWAKRILSKPFQNDEQRIEFMFQSALCRPASDSEIQLAKKFLNGSSESSSEQSADWKAWTNLAHALFNLKEFIYIR